MDKLFENCHFKNYENLREFLYVISLYPHRLIGGVAVSFYVPERIPTPGDLDFLLDPEDLVKFAEALEEKGWKVVKSGYWSIFEHYIASKDSESFDLLIHEELLQKSDYHIALWEGLKVKVLTPEWLILNKMIAGREKDQKDIELLIKSPHCDPVKLKRIIRDELGEEGLMDLESLLFLRRPISLFKHPSNS